MKLDQNKIRKYRPRRILPIVLAVAIKILTFAVPAFILVFSNIFGAWTEVALGVLFALYIAVDSVQDERIQKKKTILLSCRVKVMRDGIIYKKGTEGVVRVIVPLELGHGDLVGVDFETPSGKFFDWVRSKDLKVIESQYIQIFKNN